MGSWDAGPCYPKLLSHDGSFVRVPPGTARKDAGLERRGSVTALIRKGGRVMGVC